MASHKLWLRICTIEVSASGRPCLLKTPLSRYNILWVTCADEFDRVGGGGGGGGAGANV